MRKYILPSIALLPLLLTSSYAAQTWSVDPPARAWMAKALGAALPKARLIDPVPLQAYQV